MSLLGLPRLHISTLSFSLITQLLLLLPMLVVVADSNLQTLIGHGGS
jgi:hypothetical protein